VLSCAHFTVLVLGVWKVTLITTTTQLYESPDIKCHFFVMMSSSLYQFSNFFHRYTQQ